MSKFKVGEHSSSSTEFKKGHTTWNKGKHHSEETKKKLKESSKGKHYSTSSEFKKGQIPWNKGKHHSEETKKKLCMARRQRPGIKGWHHSEESKIRIREARAKQIIIITEETKKKMSEVKKGNKGPKGWIRTEEHRKKLGNATKIQRMNQIFPIKDTSIEVKVQDYLKALKIDFFTHQYIKDIAHGYQCDILIPTMNLIIECDGDYWHQYPIGKEIDHIRTSELIEKGFKVLRLWECEIKVMSLEDFQIKLESIKVNV